MRAVPLLLVLVLVGCGRLGFEARVGASGTGGPVPPGSETLRVTASIAECVDPNTPSMTSCTTANGSDQLVVDAEDGETHSPWESFLRFDLGDQLGGRAVHSVALVLTTTDDTKADGPDSGAVFEVEQFDRASLAVAAPAQAEVAPLAPGNGRVEKEETVVWTLPQSVATAAAVYLGVFVTSDDNGGVNYWNLDGAEPPHLEIVVR